MQSKTPMTHVAYFGHAAHDAAVRRRVQGFRDDGLEVTGFTMRRRDDPATGWDNVDLGRTYDGNYIQRVRSVFSGAELAAASGRLADADLIYARNLDMLAAAFLAKRKLGLKAPVMYECLDVHRLLTRNDPVGFIFRRLEGALLKRSRRLVVSSPGYLENYFSRRHRGQYQPVLVENRLAAGADYGDRPTRAATASSPGEPLRLGWIGVLRCARSLDLLLALAQEAGPAVEIHLHGVPALTEIPDFHERVKGVPNLTFHGSYRSPEDLAAIYAPLDVVWAGDFMEQGYNSVWLLPNRIYEGGYYGVPAIAPAGTQTAKWIADADAGFVIEEDLGQSLPALLSRLSADRSEISARRAALLALPGETFVQPPGLLKQIIKDALNPEDGTLSL